MNSRIIFLIVIVLASLVYGYQHSLLFVSKHPQEQHLVEDDANTPAAPISTSRPVATEALALDIQLQQQATINKTSPNLSAAHQNPEDENLVTEVAGTDTGTPYPSRMSHRLNERGTLLMELDVSREFSYQFQSTARSWNPETGEMKTLLSLSGYHIERGLILDKGFLFFISKNGHGKQLSSSLVFIDNEGKASSVDLKIMRNDAKLLLLSDQSVLLFGGENIAEPHARNNSFELVQVKNGVIDVQPLPDVIDPKLWGYSLVALPNARALLLGGSTDQYISCKEPTCSKKTFMLDAATKSWSDGPLLKEPHADAEASLLPDGSVIIAGGWEPDKNGNLQASTVSERWDPSESSFKLSAPLAIPAGKIRSIAANEHMPFMLISKDEGSFQAYDAKNNEWRLVGSYYGGEGNHTYAIGPFNDKKNLYMWTNISGDDDAWQKILLGISSSNSAFVPFKFDVKVGSYLSNDDRNYLAPLGNQQGIIVGGHSYERSKTSALAISSSGELTPLAPLNYYRTSIQVFRLSNGAFIVTGGDSPDVQEHNINYPPMEFLAKPDLATHWKIINIVHPLGTHYTQLTKDNLIALLPDGSLEKIDIDVSEAEPRFTKSIIGRMDLPRGDYFYTPLALRGLSDGRIIIAGGCVTQQKITSTNNKPDDFTEGEAEDVSECVPNNTYDIYNSDSHSWHQSASAHSSEGQSIILADGRVIHMSEIKVAESAVTDEKVSGLLANIAMEISNTEGTQWKVLTGNELPSMLFNSAKLFVVNDEVFIFGSEVLATGKGQRKAVQWFDQQTKRWTRVWNEERKKNPITLIQVTLANQKTLMLPIHR